MFEIFIKNGVLFFPSFLKFFFYNFFIIYSLGFFFPRFSFNYMRGFF